MIVAIPATSMKLKARGSNAMRQLLAAVAAVLIQIIGLRQYNAAQNKLGVVSLLLSLLLTAVIV